MRFAAPVWVSHTYQKIAFRGTALQTKAATLPDAPYDGGTRPPSYPHLPVGGAQRRPDLSLCAAKARDYVCGRGATSQPAHSRAELKVQAFAPLGPAADRIPSATSKFIIGLQH